MERHGRQPQPDAETPLDQFQNRPRRPQRESQLELIRRLVRDLVPHLPALCLIEQPLAAPGRYPPPVQTTLVAKLPTPLDPAIHAIPVHTDEPRRLAPAQAVMLNQPQRRRSSRAARPMLRKSCRSTPKPWRNTNRVPGKVSGWL